MLLWRALLSSLVGEPIIVGQREARVVGSQKEEYYPLITMKNTWDITDNKYNITGKIFVTDNWEEGRHLPRRSDLYHSIVFPKCLLADGTNWSHPNIPISLFP
jgi:hypothetical protein